MLTLTKISLKQTLLFSGGISLFSFVWLTIVDYRGQRKHYTILEKKVLKPLYERYNFQIESQNNNKYWGYKGSYKGYFIRVYYDWDTIFSRSDNSQEICIMLYYSPPMMESGKLNIDKLNKLNEKYKDKRSLKPYKYMVIFEASYIGVHQPYFITTKFEVIEEKLELAVKIAKDESLSPIDEGDVQKLMREDGLLHSPRIETFWK